MFWSAKYFFYLILIVVKSFSEELTSPEDIDSTSNNPGTPEENDPSLLTQHSENTSWESYKDEKWIIIISEFKTYREAKTFCRTRHQGDLLSIDFRQKQIFVEKHMTSKKISNNIWIGLESKKGNIYEWSDGTSYNYRNWALDSPKNNSDFCVQMEVANSASFGKWSDVTCSKKNFFVCQKNQAWSKDRLQNIVINNRNNPVPLGFVYVQLPWVQSPEEIWPWMTWKDISSQYAGLFFRVVGGNSETFGSIQEPSSPRITRVKAYSAFKDIDYEFKILPDNKFSPWLFTGRRTENVPVFTPE